MSNLKPITVIIVACSMCVDAYSQSASAQIYASMNFNQAAIANNQFTTSFKPVIGSTIPIQQMVTASTGDGGVATAKYNVTDNGSVATLDINASGSVTPADYGAEEGTGGNGTIFTFTVPVRYTVTLSESGAGGLNFYISGGAYINTDFSDSTRVYAGTIYPIDESVTMSEFWSLSNSLAPASQSGSDSIAMTFTPINPIPEPSTAVLILVPTALFLSHRRRKLVAT